jgi:UDP-2,4-diacetamido-2,4,6-trideoxy-beta-L-altropyranose hydrolase
MPNSNSTPYIKNPMTDVPGLLIRADADPQSGTGHVMRMLALAQAWNRRGGEAIFASIQLSAKLSDRLTGFKFVQRPGIVPGSQEDADWTLSIARATGAGFLVADGYAFGPDFQRSVRGEGLKLAVVCDFAVDAEFSCDFLINQNLGSGAEDYPNLPTESAGLFGPDFALLRSEFALANRKSRKSRRGAGKRLLITLGGSDPVDFSSRLLRALGPHAAGEGWNISMLVGSDNAKKSELFHLAADYSGVSCLAPVSNMGVLLDQADAVFSAGGSTCWELCFRGLPMAVVSIAANQNGIVHALGNAGAAVNLGWYEQVEDTAIRDAARTILGDVKKREALSARALRVVDGRGADRVAAALHGALKIVIATAGGGWVIDQLNLFVERLRDGGHEVVVVTDANESPCADLVFFLSYWSLANSEVLDRATHSLVVHASDLPKGKGWSPLTWQILEGKSRIPVRLFEAEAAVDSGDIHGAMDIEFEGHELLDEIRDRLLDATFELCLEFVANYPTRIPFRTKQEGDESFYRRRTSEDSRLNPKSSLASQFNLLRTVDNNDYPAFFEYAGHCYELHILKKNQL